MKKRGKGKPDGVPRVLWDRYCGSGGRARVRLKKRVDKYLLGRMEMPEVEGYILFNGRYYKDILNGDGE